MAAGGPSGEARLDGEIRLAIVESPDPAAPLVGALDAAEVCAWMWVRSEQVLYFSPRVLDLLNLERNDDGSLLSRCLQAIHPEDRELVRPMIDCELPAGPFVLRYRLAKRDGAFHWIENRGRVERERDGTLRCQGGAMRDISREVQQEQERAQAMAERHAVEQRMQEAEKYESLGILAGGIAHDFNNLLTAILGNATLVRAELPDESLLQSSLEQIEIASRRAADLCRQLLAYAGKGRFALQTIDLNSVVRESQSLLDVTVPKKAVLNLELAPEVLWVLGDHAQLRQVLMNLTLNAAEALGDSAGTITIATGRRTVSEQELATTVFSPQLREGRYVSLTVRDTGMGMPPDMLSRIFDPFFTTKFTGRGLGLPAVVGIVRAHSGALGVESAPGAGSTFELLLRAQSFDSHAGAQGGPGTAHVGVHDAEAPDEATLARWRTTGTALVVDDEAGVRDLLRSVLERAGLHVVMAEDGREGVERFRANTDTVRIALVDLTMPGLNGQEALGAMRKIKPDLRAVVMSGYTPAQVEIAESDAFLQKPFTPYSVRRAVWKALIPDR